MLNLQPTVTKVYLDDPLEHIEYCGRLCYNSRDKTAPGTALKFCKNLAKAGHLSVFEHAAVDVSKNMPPLTKITEADPLFGLIMSRAVLNEVRYSDLLLGTDLSIEDIAELPRFKNLMTFEVTCSRKTSQQFERHRNFSYSELSLRHYKVPEEDDFEVCVDDKVFDNPEFIEATGRAVNAYHSMVKAGFSLDEAREVLPLGTATKFCVSGDWSWWLHFLKLRLAKAASKQMIVVADQILNLMPEKFKKHVDQREDLKKQFEEARAAVKSV